MRKVVILLYLVQLLFTGFEIGRARTVNTG